MKRQFRYMKNFGAVDAGSEYVYTAWLADDSGNNVMEYTLTLEGLKSFCRVLNDLGDDK